ncbi:MAG: hypothetical protein U0Q16_18485 [Bryobacteraceae bacterium]
MKSRHLVFFLAAFAAFAQPKIDSVLNGASQIPAGLPGSAIARGSVFVVKGSKLGPADAVQSDYPLSTTLGGSSITVTVGGADVSAFLVSASATQLTAVLPSSAAAGDAKVKVTAGDQTSDAASVAVVDVGPGIFTANGFGIGPAVVKDADGNAISRTNATHEGDTVTLSLTGLGAIDTPDNELPPGADSSTAVELWVGLKSATVKTKGRSTTAAGVDAISFEVPAGVSGCAVSIAVRAGGNVSNFATVAVTAAGNKACADANGYTDQDLAKVSDSGLRIGSITLSRTQVKASVPILGTVEVKSDSASAGFQRYDPQAFLQSTGSLQASYGSCVVIASNGTDVSKFAGDPVAGTKLDAGPSLTLTGPGGMKTLTGKDGSYFADLGTSTGSSIPLPIPIPGLGGGTAYLEPGSYTVTGPGGADVKSFTAQLTVPRPITWTNQDAITTVNRSRDLTLNWTGGGSNDFAIIAGSSAKGKASAQFVCTAPAGASSFTVPAVVLSALPGSDTPASITSPTGSLAIVQAPLGDATRFTADGIDIGVITYVTAIGKTVTYQ